MKKILHLTITEALPDSAQQVIDNQKKSIALDVEVMRLTTENADVALEKIFAADSICVWPQG